jgi:hypothetical protein
MSKEAREKISAGMKARYAEIRKQVKANIDSPEYTAIIDIVERLRSLGIVSRIRSISMMFHDPQAIEFNVIVEREERQFQTMPALNRRRRRNNHQIQ